MILFALMQAVAQPATPPVTRATSAPTAERFSVLAAPCARTAGQTIGNDVVVCGSAADMSRLPFPDEVPPTRPLPSNPTLTGAGALATEGTPCAATPRGCTVGIGGPVVAAAVQGLATAVSDGIADAKVRKARKRDAGRRVPIPLD